MRPGRGGPAAGRRTSRVADPARTLALADVGALEAGRRADVLVVDDDLRLGSVLRAGQWLG